jgi:hypothetical protein
LPPALSLSVLLLLFLSPISIQFCPFPLSFLLANLEILFLPGKCNGTWLAMVLLWSELRASAADQGQIRPSRSAVVSAVCGE